jgi:hypothetical protein
MKADKTRSDYHRGDENRQIAGASLSVFFGFLSVIRVSVVIL